MFAVLSAGLLIVLTGTTVSDMQPVFADKDEEECEDNGDSNCNEESQKVRQDTNCKIANGIENEDKSDNNTNDGNDNGDMSCWDLAQNPQNGSAIIDLFPATTVTTLDPFALIG